MSRVIKIVLFTFGIALLIGGAWASYRWVPVWVSPVPEVGIPEGPPPPSCIAPSTELLVGDGMLRFRAPATTEVRGFTGADTVSFTIDSPENPADRLEIVEGPLVGLPIVPFGPPPPRDFECSGFDGWDVRFAYDNDLQSRRIGMIGQSAGYSRVSQASAGYFDSILDTRCCAEPWFRIQDRVDELRGRDPRDTFLVQPFEKRLYLDRER